MLLLQVHIRLWRCWPVLVLDSNFWALWGLLQQPVLPEFLLHNGHRHAASSVCPAGWLLC